jgi:protein TonB
MTFPDDSGTHDPPARATYRVPIGLPLRDEGRKQGALVSIAVHALIIALLLMPIVLTRTVITRIEQGAGGPGPAGGGGGGNGGLQAPREKLQFVRVAPEPVPTPKTLPPVPVPVIPKLQPPVQQVTPPVQPPVKPMDQALAPTPQVTIAAGLGPGSGHDGTTGNGPGTGGGVGSGIGTGRGSGVGPGTGGGSQVNYLPTPIEFFLPPLPAPKSVQGFKFIAEFDVDSTGRVLDFKFSETRDGDYNRRIVSVLRQLRFRPGTRPDGTPVRMKAQVTYEF